MRSGFVSMVAVVWGLGCYASNGDEGGHEGESGLERADRLAELPEPSALQLCDWGVAIGAVGVPENPCPNGEVIVAPTRDECVQSILALTCDITVASIEACFLAMADDSCTGFHSGVCEPPPGCEP